MVAEILKENMRLRAALAFTSGYLSGMKDRKVKDMGKVCSLVLDGEDVLDAYDSVKERNPRLVCIEIQVDLSE